MPVHIPSDAFPALGEVKKVLDVVEMLVAVKGTTEAELVWGRLHVLDEI